MDATRYKLLTSGVLGLAVTVCLLVFLVPLPHIAQVSAVRWQTIVLLAASVVTIGATVLFLSGLSNFKTSLRVAYVMLAGGLVLYSFAALQLPIVSLFQGWATLWWSKSGLIVVPFLVATVMVYAGMRRFARLLEIHTLPTSFIFVSGAAIVSTVVAYVLGHYFSVNRAGYDAGAYPAVSAWAAAYSTFAMVVARAILQRIGPTYKDASWWLFLAMAVSTFSGWHQFFLTLFININAAYFTYGVAFLPVVASGLLFLRAGYAFGLLSVDARMGVGAEAPLVRQVEDSDYVDGVVAISKLASRIEQVDPMLDDLRVITSTAQSGAQLSPESRQRLLDLYKRVESYLLHNDPLRNFTTAEVRSKLSPAFRAILERQTSNR